MTFKKGWMEDPVAFLRQIYHPQLDPATLSEKTKQLTLEENNKVAVNKDFLFQVDGYISNKSREISTGLLRSNLEETAPGLSKMVQEENRLYQLRFQP